jgi:hypothetical protein
MNDIRLWKETSSRRVGVYRRVSNLQQYLGKLIQSLESVYKIVHKEARDIVEISDQMMARLELYMTSVELQVSNMLFFQGQQLSVMYY